MTACTFVVVGHNEEERLHVAVALALEAAGPRDRVWFLDSASTDGSVARASALGAEIVVGPIGKGAAMAVAFERCRDGVLCFLDADMEEAGSNFASRLRSAIEETNADMVVGQFDEPGRRLTLTPTLYRPLVGALFPESLALDIRIPLCGFRAVRADLDWGRIPPGYGVETHLNLIAGVERRSVANCDLGYFRGPLRGYRNIVPSGRDVTTAILDLAVELGRLGADLRPVWDAWVEQALDYIARQPPEGADDDEFMQGIERLAARELPPVD